MIEQLAANTVELALLSAPWLLLGLVVAGLIKAFMPVELVGRSLGGAGLGAVTRAALIGAPLPLCSCGTLPAAFALRRSGASKASTTSFLIATPETGVDSVALSWVLLGPLLALFRPVAAVASAIAAGLLVGRTENGAPVAIPVASVPAINTSEASCSSGRCCIPSPAPDPPASVWGRFAGGMRYAFSDLLDDLAVWLAVGIVAAGAVVTWVPPDVLAEWGSGLPAMLLIMLVSVPMYVCATASTPLAHAMLYAGVSPGTVLVFMLAGPASNLAGLILVYRELGRRALLAYLFGVAGVSVLLGLGLDLAIGMFGLDPLVGQGGDGTDAETPFTLSVLSLLLLVLLAVKPFRRFLFKGKAGDDGDCCG